MYQGKKSKKGKDKKKHKRSSKGKDRSKDNDGKPERKETPQQLQKRIEKEEKQRAAEKKKEAEKKKRAIVQKAKQARRLFSWQVFDSIFHSMPLDLLGIWERLGVPPMQIHCWYHSQAVNSLNSKIADALKKESLLPSLLWPQAKAAKVEC